MVKLVFRVTLPDELVQSLLQALRDWDMKHDPNHEGKVQTEQLLEADWPVERMEAMFASINPPMAFKATMKFDS